MEDLIRSVETLFVDESPPQSSPVPSFHVAETMSSDPYPSTLFLSPESPQFAAFQDAGSTPRHHEPVVDDPIQNARSTRSDERPSRFPSFNVAETTTCPDDSGYSHPASSLFAPLSPLLGLSSSTTPVEGVETTAEEMPIPGARATVVLPNGTPLPDVVPFSSPTSVAERRFTLPRLERERLERLRVYRSRIFRDTCEPGPTGPGSILQSPIQHRPRRRHQGSESPPRPPGLHEGQTAAGRLRQEVSRRHPRPQDY